MPLSESYNCDAVLGNHVCIPCNTNKEFGRVRSGGFVTTTYLPTLMANPTSVAAWQAGIASGDIIVVPETAGTYDPGEPTALRGYGNRSKTNGPRSQKLVLEDPTYFDNYEFYNTISDVTNLVPFYRTSSLVHIADVPASVFASDPIEDDLKSEINWRVTIDWESRNLPSKFSSTALETAGVFECSDVTGAASFNTVIPFNVEIDPDAVAGVTGTGVGGTDAEQKFEFNAIANPTGTGLSMTIKVNNIEECLIDTQTDYAGQNFKYTDKAGVAHTGTFTDGVVNF